MKRIRFKKEKFEDVYYVYEEHEQEQEEEE